MNVKTVENAIQNSIEIYEQSVDLLKTFQLKCNDQNRGIKFIADNCETLRSNDKLIGLYRSILEEATSVILKSGNDCAGSSVEFDDAELCDSSAAASNEEKYRPSNTNNRGTAFYIEEHVDLTKQHVRFKETVTMVHFPNEMDDATADDSSSIESTGETRESSPTENFSVDTSNECEVDIDEEKYRPGSDGSSFHIEGFEDFANQHVSFVEAATVVHFPNEMDETTTIEPLPTPSTDEAASSRRSTGETAESDPKKKRLTHNMPKLFGSALRKAKRLKKAENLKKRKTSIAAMAIEQTALVSVASDGQIDVQRNWKRTVGLCCICDKRNSFSRIQWQLHLLSHTTEKFYFCKQCGHTFSKRHQHITCLSAVISDIFEQYHCVGEDSLAAFVCNICGYARVSESRIVKHLNIKHNVKGNCKQYYDKKNLIKLV